jgi:hypothetical protein
MFLYFDDVQVFDTVKSNIRDDTEITKRTLAFGSEHLKLLSPVVWCLYLTLISYSQLIKKSDSNGKKSSSQSYKSNLIFVIVQSE